MNKLEKKPIEKQEIYITDMRRCQPAAFLSEVGRKHRWQLIPYETEELSGVMLGANSSTEAPDVTIPLGVSGWYAIYLAFWNPIYAYDGGTKVKIKLTGDPCFRVISDPEPVHSWPGWANLKEVFVKYADISGKDIVIGQQSKGISQKAYVAYLKLVPLSKKEVKAIETDRARKDTRILYALNDGNGFFYNGPTTREDLLEQVEQYRHSDVGAVLFACASGDLVNYPSKLGTPWLADRDKEIVTPRWRILRDSTETLLTKGIVPMQVFTEHLHQMGIAVHAQFRMSILGSVPPDPLWRINGLVRRRPNLRMVDRDGTPVEKASYAFPEVRQFMLSLIREVAEGYDIDGVNLCFIRGPQFVGYEEIVVEDFKKEYGIDLRSLDENDIRAQRHRAGYLTKLVREIRRLVDDIGRNKSKKIELSAIVFNFHGENTDAPFSSFGNLFFGVDVETWLNEGLLDSIFTDGEGFDPKILKAIRSHNCKLIFALSQDKTRPIQALKVGYEAGVDGFWRWDTPSVQEMPEYWAVLSRVGHK